MGDQGGGGGGGGAYSKKDSVSVTASNSYTINVGGIAGDSYFIDTSTALAKGGATASGVTGGSGGASGSGVGDTKFSGGNGVTGRTFVQGGGGGGGGSSAGSSSNGTNASGSSGGTAPTGGGNGGTGALPGEGSSAAVNGTAPGGAGGGGDIDGSAIASGATGRIILTYTVIENSAPSISSSPSDGGSSSSVPTYPGTTIVFSAVAADANSDNYYLAICKTDSITASTSAAPTCGGGEWCISSATDSGMTASCSLAIESQSVSSGSNAWYAFVCDNKASSLCSSSSQGSGNNGSPLYVGIFGSGGGGNNYISIESVPAASGSSVTSGNAPVVEYDLVKELTEQIISLMLKIIESLQSKIMALKLQKGL